MRSTFARLVDRLLRRRWQTLLRRRELGEPAGLIRRRSFALQRYTPQNRNMNVSLPAVYRRIFRSGA
jgi:hypothetical protein